MRYYYYEIIGGLLFELDPSLLFVRTRAGYIPLFRMVMMYYRRDVLKMTLSASAARYNMDHASVIHARKTVNNMRETDRYFAELMDTFLKSCEREIENNTEDIADHIKSGKLDKPLIEGVIYRAFSRYNRLQYYISMAMNDNGDHRSIMEMIDTCRKDLDVFESIFSETSNIDSNGTDN